MSDGSVTIDVTLTKEQFNKAVKELGYDLDKLGKNNKSILSNMSKGLNTLGDMFTSVGSSFKKASGVIMGALAGITAGLGTAISRYDTIKNFPKVMSNLGIESSKAEKSIDELSKGIDGLPTALDDAVSGVSRLVAKNQDIDKSTKYFLAMNNAIVAGNAPMELQKSALEQLTQAYTKGKADMMEWRTMMMAMPGQLTQVAKAYGISTDELYEKLKKGKISMDDFMNTIVELNEKGIDGFQSFSEQAKNSTDSIGTAVTNLGNRIKKGFASILESIDRALGNTSLGSVAGLINTISETIRDAMARIGNAIENSQAFKDFIEKLAIGISKLQEKINNIDEEQLTKLVDILIKLIEWAPKLFIVGEAFTIIGSSMKKVSGIISTVQSLSSLIGAIPPQALAVIAVIALVTAGLIYLYKTNEDFRNAVLEGIEKVKAVFNTLWGMLQPVFESIKEQLASLKEKMQPLIDLMQKILPPVIKAIIVVLGTLLASVIFIATKIVEYYLIAYNKFIDIVTAIINFFTQTIPNAIMWLYNKIVEIGTAIIEFVKGIVDGVILFFTETIPNAITSLFEIISSFIEGVKEGISNFLAEAEYFFTHLDVIAGEFIGKLIADFINGLIVIKDFIFITIPEIVSNVISWLGDLWERIKEWFANTIENIVTWLTNLYERIKQFLFDTLEKIKQWGIDTFNWVTKEVPKIIENIVNFFKELPGKIWNWLQNTIQKFIEFLNNMKNKAKEGAKQTSDNIENGIKELPGKMLEIGRNIVEGIWNGITGAVGWLHDRISNFCQGVVDGFKANLKIQSPSKIFRDDIGTNIALGIGEGFVDTISRVYQEMENSVANETNKLGKEMTSTGNVSIERNANITSLLNGIIDQETTYTSNTYLDGKVLTSTVNKYNARNRFAQGMA